MRVACLALTLVGLTLASAPLAQVVTDVRTERARIANHFRQYDYASIEGRVAELDRTDARNVVGGHVVEFAMQWEQMLLCEAPATPASAPAGEPWTAAVCSKFYGEVFDAWQQAFPRSDLPAIGRAHLRAFEVSRVRPADPLWSIGHAAARKALDAVPTRDRSVKWYAAAFHLAAVGGSPEAWMEQALEEALTKFRGRPTVFRFAVNYYAPKSGGSYRQLEGLARRVADANPGPTADLMYAVIYDQFFLTSGMAPVFAFQQSAVAWHRMRAGLQANYAQYPHPWNAAKTAQYACLAHDLPLLRQMLAAAGSAEANRNAWFSGEEQRCRTLASPPPGSRGVAAVSGADSPG